MGRRAEHRTIFLCSFGFYGVSLWTSPGVSFGWAGALGVGIGDRVRDVSLSCAPTSPGGDKSLRIVAEEAGLAFRTVQRWAAQYRTFGLSALVRKAKGDRGGRRVISAMIKTATEGLALESHSVLVTSVHRQIKGFAEAIGEPAPRYWTVYDVVRELPPSLPSLALRQGIWRKDHSHWHICGVPGILYADNGADFTSKHLHQVAADLKIRLVFSIPASRRGASASSVSSEPSARCSSAIWTTISGTNAGARAPR